MRTISPIELGIAGNGVAYRNLAPAQLVEAALRRGEGKLCLTLYPARGILTAVLTALIQHVRLAQKNFRKNRRI